MRGVVPDGFGGALSVRGPRGPPARAPRPRRGTDAAAVAMIRLLTTHTTLSSVTGRWRRGVGRVGQELEDAAVGHLQFLREAAVRAVARRQRDHRQRVARLQAAPVGAAQARPAKAGQPRHLERPLRHLAVGVLDVHRQVGMRVDELDSRHRAADAEMVLLMSNCAWIEWCADTRAGSATARETANSALIRKRVIFAPEKDELRDESYTPGRAETNRPRCSLYIVGSRLRTRCSPREFRRALYSSSHGRCLAP